MKKLFSVILLTPILCLSQANLLNTKSSFECLLLSHEDISPSDYHHFEQSKKMKVIYVEQFDDSLWQGYDILEPTQQMREYKKPIYDY